MCGSTATTRSTPRTVPAAVSRSARNRPFARPSNRRPDSQIARDPSRSGSAQVRVTWFATPCIHKVDCWMSVHRRARRLSHQRMPSPSVQRQSTKSVATRLGVCITTPTDRSISPSSSTSTTPVAMMPSRGDLEHQVGEVARGEEVLLGDGEVEPDDDQADDHRERAELALARTRGVKRVQRPASPSGSTWRRGSRAGRGGRSAAQLHRRLGVVLAGRGPAEPGPLVIAPTTSSRRGLGRARSRPRCGRGRAPRCGRRPRRRRPGCG